MDQAFEEVRQCKKISKLRSLATDKGKEDLHIKQGESRGQRTSPPVKEFKRRDKEKGRQKRKKSFLEKGKRKVSTTKVITIKTYK